jgi:hypothetical protein
MEFVIIALILAKFCEKGAIDIVSMATGNQPPSKTYQAAKGATAEAGPLGKFVKAWWADAIEDLDEKRRIKRMETKEEQERARAERKADRQRILDAIDEKARADEAEREERERGPAEDIPVEEPPHPDDAEADSPPPFDDPDRAAPDSLPLEDEPETTVIDPPVPEETEPAAEDETIVDAVIVEDEPETVQGPEGPKIPEFKVITGSTEEPVNDTEWSPYRAKPELYAVPDQTEESTGAAGQMEGTNMTSTQVAVEGGITQHINWTAAMADYQIRASAHVEMVGASMFKGDNGPARLAMVASIQEMHRQMREAYLQLNAILVNDKNLVGDAYAATGGQAGGKPYVTS